MEEAQSVDERPAGRHVCQSASPVGDKKKYKLK